MSKRQGEDESSSKNRMKRKRLEFILLPQEVGHTEKNKKNTKAKAGILKLHCNMNE